MDVLRSILPNAESFAAGRDIRISGSKSADHTRRAHIALQQHGRNAQDIAYIVETVSRVVGRQQGGRIDFQLFKAEYGARKKVKLYAPKDAKLSFVKSVPELLDVDVTIKEGKVDGTQREWDLDVAVRPRTDAGALPKDGVIVLRYELPAQGNTPAANRLVSIPVVGTATRN